MLLEVSLMRRSRSLLHVSCFILGYVFVAAQASPVLLAQTYQFKVIQPFQPNGSNSVGAVVGQLGAPVLGIYANGAFYTQISDPMLPKTRGNTELFAINQGGVVVGASDVRGFVLKNGVFTTLTVSGARTFPYTINDAGVIGGGYLSGNNTLGFILGKSGVKTFPFAVVGINNHDHILFSNGNLDVNGSITPMAYPGAGDTTVSGLNDSDSVVGSYTDTQFVAHGFVWTAGKYTTIDYPNATFTRTQAIDNYGRVAGFAFTATGIVGFTAKPTP